MKTSLKRLATLTALGLSLGLSLGIDAQAHPMGDGPWDGARFEQHRTQMAKFHEKRLAALKTKLHLSSAQEAAWASFEQAHQPPSRPLTQALDRDALAKLSTPERIEQMQRQFDAHHVALQEQMKQRADATRQFYAQLTPEQQKVFDAETLPPGRGERMGRLHDAMRERAPAAKP